MKTNAVLPLSGITVIDFSTLLPGPLCTRMLAAAGARVIKVERPGGEDMRNMGSAADGISAHYRMLNEGKQIVEIDLRDPQGLSRARDYLASADVLVEQFRPGVMERLGLGYADAAAVNPRLVYCSITGYGQSGPDALTAGHDLNYLAEAGLLALTDPPSLPPGLIADIGGGSWPAVMNILLALRQRDLTGSGSHLDMSMRDNVAVFGSWALAEWAANGAAPSPGAGLLAGGSPRYRIYRAACGGHLACAPLEQKFWNAFCELIGLAAPYRDDRADPSATIAAVAGIMATRSAKAWMAIFAGHDVCVSPVTPVDEVMRQRQAATPGADRMTLALPLPLAPAMRGTDRS